MVGSSTDLLIRLAIRRTCRSGSPNFVLECGSFPSRKVFHRMDITFRSTDHISHVRGKGKMLTFICFVVFVDLITHV